MSLPNDLYYLETGEYKNQRLLVSSSSCSQFMYKFSSTVTNNGASNCHLIDSVCYPSPTDPFIICSDPNAAIPLSGRGTLIFVVC